MNKEVWVLGATGRTGRIIAKLLHARGVPLGLVGRDRLSLEKLAAELGGTPRLVVGPLESTLASLTQAAPAVVINTVGPFTRTAPEVTQACPPGTHYIDLTNELLAVEKVLELDRKAAAAGQVFVSGAGFGVLATESVLLRLCEGQPPAKQVRVDALASVAIEPGVVGIALAGTIVEVLSFGGREVRQGRLVRSRLAANLAQLTTPNGEIVATAGGASGELLAAWRGSKAANVVGASTLVPTGPVARFLLPPISLVFRIPAVSHFTVNRLARMKTKGRARPRPNSWGHARVEWADGKIREGWLRAGDGMDFTTAVAAEVAYRLFNGEGRPGAYTPGALFGPELAEAAGGEFILDLAVA